MLRQVTVTADCSTGARLSGAANTRAQAVMRYSVFARAQPPVFGGRSSCGSVSIAKCRTNLAHLFSWIVIWRRCCERSTETTS